jgi:threonine/homoserine/homoserine lactone efflux protein
MPFLVFLSGAVIVSLSGVLAPGPITAVTIGKGNDSPHSGAWIAIGHGIVEFPLMILLALGIGHFLTNASLKTALEILGGLVLIFMAIGLLRGIAGQSVHSSIFSGSPVLAGTLLTLGSPFFFVWWATVGATLILQSLAYGMAGFVALCLAHWLCDFIWGYFLSAISYAGGQFFGRRFQQVVFGVCGLALLVFGGWFLYSAAATLLA